MSEKSKEARRAYWASIPPEERKLRLQAVATSRWANTTPEERLNHAMLMVKARQNGKTTK